jgi:hypothetical protein
MIRLRRLSILLVPMLLGLASLSRPGRAQTTPARYAFADTTLLRDTLGLHFVRLFPLADSLRLTPDTLRALSIRYVYTLERLVVLADSLGMPVDSVGPFLKREKNNVLTLRDAGSSTFHYMSGYSLGQSNSRWQNSSDWRFSRRGLLLTNTTDISMERYLAGQFTSLRQTRVSTTEAGWRVSSDMSIGGKADLHRFDSHDPNSASNENTSDDSYQFSLRSRQRPRPGVSSEINVLSGLLNQLNSQQIKRGISNEINGRVRSHSGDWISNEVDGRLVANFAKTRLPGSGVSANAHDQATDIHGTLSVLENSPTSFNLNYVIKDSRVQAPTDSGRTQEVRSKNNSLDGTLRLRRGAARYVNITGHLGNLQQVQNSSQDLVLSSESSRNDLGTGLEAHLDTRSWQISGHFALNGALSKFPNRDVTGGYGESLFVRSIDATIGRSLGTRVVAQASGTVSLSSYRYLRIGSYRTLPVNNDQYRQSYRVQATYTPSAKGRTTVALDVIRSLAINLPAASTAGNNEDRTYRAEWSWTYQLLPMLTATQRNLISADYLFYNFSPTNNRLTLDYSSVTGLNAVLTPRLTLDLTHNARQQPSGLYVVGNDGIEAFGRSDESRSYSLLARVAYTPVRGLSLSLEPNYLSIQRSGTSNGVLVPQRSTNTLNFSGGASLNLALGQRTHLTGDIRRVVRADRATLYTSGVAQLSPLSQTDFWTSSLILTWDM